MARAQVLQRHSRSSRTAAVRLYLSPHRAREEELGYLKEEAEAIKGQLEQIDSRMRDLEAEE